MDENAIDFAKRHLPRDVTYDTLMTAFLSMSQEKKETIVRLHGSFIDWLISASKTGEKFSSITPIVHNAIRKRLVVDLEVAGSIPISDIRSQHPAAYISKEQLVQILKKFNDFEICSYSSGEEFCFLASKITREISRSSAASGSCRTCYKRPIKQKRGRKKLRKAYVFLETVHPHLIGALTKSVSWKLLEKLNVVFRARYRHVNGTFVDWLMGLVEYKRKKSLAKYEQALSNCLVQRASSCVKTWPCSLQQVTDAVCRGYVQLVSVDFMLRAFRRASGTFDVVTTRLRCGEHKLIVVKLPSTLHSIKDQKLVANSEGKSSSSSCNCQTTASTLASSEDSSSGKRTTDTAAGSPKTPQRFDFQIHSNQATDSDQGSKLILHVNDVKDPERSGVHREMPAIVLPAASAAIRSTPCKGVQPTAVLEGTQGDEQLSKLKQISFRLNSSGPDAIGVSKEDFTAVVNLLSATVTWKDVLEVFTNLFGTVFMREVLSNHDSFVEFLVKQANIVNPQLGGSNYRWILQNQLKLFLTQFFKRDEMLSVVNLFNLINCQGLVKYDFFRKTLEADSTLFLVRGDEVVLAGNGSLSFDADVAMDSAAQHLELAHSNTSRKMGCSFSNDYTADETCIAPRGAGSSHETTDGLFVPFRANNFLKDLFQLKVRDELLEEAFRNLQNHEPMFLERIVLKHGCFLEFLIKHAKITKPKLNSALFRRALQNELKTIMHRVLSVASSFMNIENLFKKVTNGGFADHNFCETTFQAHQDSFLVYKKLATALDHVFSSKACVRSKANSRCFNAFLKLPGIREFVNKKPNLDEIMVENSVLSKNVKSLISSKDVSFFGFLMLVAKKQGRPGRTNRHHLLLTLFDQVHRHVKQAGCLSLQNAANRVSQGREGLISVLDIEESYRVSNGKIVIDASGNLTLSEPTAACQSVADYPCPPLLFHSIKTKIFEILSAKRFSANGLRYLEMYWLSLPIETIDMFRRQFKSIFDFANTAFSASSVVQDFIIVAAELRLGPQTMTVRELASSLTIRNMPLILPDALVEILGSDKRFVIVKCPGKEVLVCALRSQHFLGESQKKAVTAILEMFNSSHSDAINLDYMVRTIRESGSLTQEQGLVLFGNCCKILPSCFAMQRAYLRRFLLMFPTIFTVVDHLRKPWWTSVFISSDAYAVLETLDKDGGRPGKAPQTGSVELANGIQSHETVSEYRDDATLLPVPDNGCWKEDLHEKVSVFIRDFLKTIDKSRGVRLKRLIRHVRSKFESRLAAVPMRTLSPWLRSLIQKLPPVSITAQRVLVRQQKGLQDQCTSNSNDVANNHRTKKNVTSVGQNDGVLEASRCEVVGNSADAKVTSSNPDQLNGNSSEAVAQKSNLKNDCKEDVAGTKSGVEQMGTVSSSHSEETTLATDPRSGLQTSSLQSGTGAKRTSVQGSSPKIDPKACKNQQQTDVPPVIPNQAASQSQQPQTTVLSRDSSTASFSQMSARVDRAGISCPDSNPQTNLDCDEMKPIRLSRKRRASLSSSTEQNIITKDAASKSNFADDYDNSSTESLSNQFESTTKKRAKRENISAEDNDLETSDAVRKPSENLHVFRNHSESLHAAEDLESDRSASTSNMINANGERMQKLRCFLSKYFSERNNCAQTKHLLEAARKHFAGEDFAQSKVAFEACVLHHLLTAGGRFAFGAQFGAPGCSWIFHRFVTEDDSDDSVTFPHVELLSEVRDACKSYLQTAPRNTAGIGVLVKLIAKSFGARMSSVKGQELNSVCRYLILIGCLNDENIRFASSEAAVSLCNKLDRSLTPVSVQNLRHSVPDVSSKQVSKQGLSCKERPVRAQRVPPKKSHSRLVAEGLLLIAKLVRERSPLTKADLSQLWSAEAGKDLHSVLGTCVSFTITLKKCERWLRSKADGTLFVDDVALERILKKLR